MRSCTSLALVAGAAALLTACGGERAKTVTRTTTTPSRTGASVPQPVPSGTASAPATPTGSSCPAGARCAATPAQAAALIRSLGYPDAGTGAYSASLPLDVVVADKGGDGTAQNAFFFAHGRYIGTDTADLSAGIRVSSISGDIVALTYALYKSSDPQCCPSAGAATVRFHWDGTHLTPLDRIPPSSYGGSGSRR